MTWNTGSSSPGEPLMTCSTSDVAACCSSASASFFFRSALAARRRSTSVLAFVVFERRPVSLRLFSPLRAKITSSAQSLDSCWSPQNPSNREHNTLVLLCEIVHTTGPNDQTSLPTNLGSSDLMERPLVLAHELANFSCKRSKDFLSLGLSLSGTIRQLLFNSEVWW